jgi:hypothetical protein
MTSLRWRATHFPPSPPEQNDARGARLRPDFRPGASNHEPAGQLGALATAAEAQADHSFDRGYCREGELALTGSPPFIAGAVAETVADALDNPKRVMLRRLFASPIARTQTHKLASRFSQRRAARRIGLGRVNQRNDNTCSAASMSSGGQSREYFDRTAVPRRA